MKKIINSYLIILSVFTSNTSFSQISELTNDSFTKIGLGKTEFFNAVLGKDGDNYIIDKQGVGLNFLSGVYTLIKINEHGEQIAEQVMKTEIDGENFICKKAINFGGKTVMIGTTLKKGAMNQIYLYPIDLKSLQFTGTPIKVCDYNGGYKYATITSFLPAESAEKFDFRDISFSVSPDKKMIGFITKSEFLGAGKEKHHIAVFNRDFLKVYEKDVTLLYEDNAFVAEKILIDSIGNIFLHGYNPKNYTEFFISFSENGNKTANLKVPVSVITSASTITTDGEIIYTGISNGGKNLFLTIINPIDNIIDKTEEKIADPELLKFLFGSEYSSASTLPDFEIQEILPRESGGYYVIGEQKYFHTIPNHPSMIGTGSLLVYSIAADFSIEWMKSIKKDELVNPDFDEIGSYVSLIYHNDLILFYNDDSRNISDLNACFRFTPTFKACVTKTTISSNGDIKKEELISDKENLAIRNDVVQLVDENKIFMSVKQQGGSDMLGVIPLK